MKWNGAEISWSEIFKAPETGIEHLEIFIRGAALAIQENFEDSGLNLSIVDLMFALEKTVYIRTKRRIRASDEPRIRKMLKRELLRLWLEKFRERMGLEHVNGFGDCQGLECIADEFEPYQINDACMVFWNSTAKLLPSELTLRRIIAALEIRPAKKTPGFGKKICQEWLKRRVVSDFNTGRKIG